MSFEMIDAITIRDLRSNLNTMESNYLSWKERAQELEAENRHLKIRRAWDFAQLLSNATLYQIKSGGTLAHHTDLLAGDRKEKWDHDGLKRAMDDLGYSRDEQHELFGARGFDLDAGNRRDAERVGVLNALQDGKMSQDEAEDALEEIDSRCPWIKGVPKEKQQAEARRMAEEKPIPRREYTPEEIRQIELDKKAISHIDDVVGDRWAEAPLNDLYNQTKKELQNRKPGSAEPNVQTEKDFLKAIIAQIDRHRESVQHEKEVNRQRRRKEIKERLALGLFFATIIGMLAGGYYLNENAERLLPAPEGHTASSDGG